MSQPAQRRNGKTEGAQQRPFSLFESLTRRLVSVPKKEIDAEKAKANRVKRGK